MVGVAATAPLQAGPGRPRAVPSRRRTPGTPRPPRTPRSTADGAPARAERERADPVGQVRPSQPVHRARPATRCPAHCRRCRDGRSCERESSDGPAAGVRLVVAASRPVGGAIGAPGSSSPQPAPPEPRLTPAMLSLISRAEVGVVATADAHGECDSSLRTGPPGFVRVLDASRVAYPEYRGNGVMASLGNIEENPRAGLVLIDFARGRNKLHLSGGAGIVSDTELRAAHPDLPAETVPGRRTDVWVVLEIETASLEAGDGVPALVPVARARDWGTDDSARKGGDYFGAAAQLTPRGRTVPVARREQPAPEQPDPEQPAPEQPDPEEPAPSSTPQPPPRRTRTRSTPWNTPRPTPVTTPRRTRWTTSRRKPTSPPTSTPTRTPRAVPPRSRLDHGPGGGLRRDRRLDGVVPSGRVRGHGRARRRARTSTAPRGGRARRPRRAARGGPDHQPRRRRRLDPAGDRRAHRCRRVRCRRGCRPRRPDRTRDPLRPDRHRERPGDTHRRRRGPAGARRRPGRGRLHDPAVRAGRGPRLRPHHPGPPDGHPRAGPHRRAADPAAGLRGARPPALLHRRAHPGRVGRTGGDRALPARVRRGAPHRGERRRRDVRAGRVADARPAPARRAAVVDIRARGWLCVGT